MYICSCTKFPLDLANDLGVTPVTEEFAKSRVDCTTCTLYVYLLLRGVSKGCVIFSKVCSAESTMKTDLFDVFKRPHSGITKFFSAALNRPTNKWTNCNQKCQVPPSGNNKFKKLIFSNLISPTVGWKDEKNEENQFFKISKRGASERWKIEFP